jgi:hypothetical protein
MTYTHNTLFSFQGTAIPYDKSILYHRLPIPSTPFAQILEKNFGGWPDPLTERIL